MRESKANQLRRESVNVTIPLPADNTESHFFISHAQSSGGDQANTLCLELERMGFVVGDLHGRVPQNELFPFLHTRRCRPCLSLLQGLV